MQKRGVVVLVVDGDVIGKVIGVGRIVTIIVTVNRRTRNKRQSKKLLCPFRWMEAAALAPAVVPPAPDE